MYDWPNGLRKSSTGNTILGPKFINKTGSVLYGSLNYSKNCGAFQSKANEPSTLAIRHNHRKRVSMGKSILFPPWQGKTHTVIILYQPATQELGELAGQAEIRISVQQDWDLTLHFSTINTEKARKSSIVNTCSNPMYTGMKIHVDCRLTTKRIQSTRSTKASLGSNHQNSYPYIDFTKRLDEVRSFRIDAEYMSSGRIKAAGPMYYWNTV